MGEYLVEIIIGLGSLLSGFLLKGRLAKAKAQDVSADTDAKVSSQWRELYELLTSEFKSHKEESNKRIKQLEKDFSDCEGNHRATEKTLNDLNNKVLHLETSVNELPFPMWMKDIDGKVLYVNQDYENSFLRPMGKTISDYLNHTDYDVWPKEIADEFNRNDKAVVKSRKKYWVGTEPIIVAGNDISDEWKIIKYVRFAGKVPLGISGVAVPII